MMALFILMLVWFNNFFKIKYTQKKNFCNLWEILPFPFYFITADCHKHFKSVLRNYGIFFIFRGRDIKNAAYKIVCFSLCSIIQITNILINHLRVVIKSVQKNVPFQNKNMNTYFFLSLNELARGCATLKLPCLENWYIIVLIAL